MNVATPVGRAFALLFILSIGGCGASADPRVTTSAPPLTYRVTGEMNVPGGYTVVDSDKGTCAGTGGYDDLHEGTQVVVTDDKQATIALGSVTEADDSAYGCRLIFDIDGVPAGKPFYGVEVSHRGRVQYTEAQIQNYLKLTLE